MPDASFVLRFALMTFGYHTYSLNDCWKVTLNFYSAAGIVYHFLKDMRNMLEFQL